MPIAQRKTEATPCCFLGFAGARPDRSPDVSSMPDSADARVLGPELCLLDKTASEISKRFVPLLFVIQVRPFRYPTTSCRPPMHKPYIFTISTSCIYVVGIRVQTR